MTLPSPFTAPEALLADHAWARRLARRLVNDPNLADDLAQETWMRALERPPEEGWSRRSWLGGVLRNLVRQGRRERARREAREHAAARPEASTSAAEALQRMAVQQEVVRAVLGLEEPYRSTIVLRFYEDLPPRRIASRQGVPVATVKTRLARGLAELRRALDREHGGDGGSWAVVLLPLLRRPPVLPLVAGVLTVSTIPKVSLAAIAVLALVLFARREHEPASLGETATEAPAVALSGARAPAIEHRAETREVVVPAPAVHAPATMAAAAPIEPVERVHGRAVDMAGEPVAGVELGLRHASASTVDDLLTSSIHWDEELDRVASVAVSAADGRFSFVLESDGDRPSAARIVSLDERWETVLSPSALPDAERTVVVTPRIRLSGHVRDEAGAPLGGVELYLRLPRDSVSGLNLDLDGAFFAGWCAQSDAVGTFTFERLPSVRAATLVATLAPYVPAEIAREVWGDDELEIVLHEPAGAWLTGRVEARGAALAGATVALGRDATESAADGSFRLSLVGHEDVEELCAVAPGLLPARLRGDRDPGGPVRWPAFVRLVLAGEPLELAGVVQDASGAPLASQEVWLADPTIAYAQDASFPVLLESRMSGSSDMRHGAKSDEHGRFRIGGLEQRNYELRVIDPATAYRMEVGPFAAGDHGIVLRRPADALWKRVRGRVLSRAGVPAAGVQVAIQCMNDTAGLDGSFIGFPTDGAQATTADDGTFELLDVPRAGVTLHVNGAGVSDPELALEAGQDPENLVITVGARVRLQVQASEAHRQATHVAVLDTDGQPLWLTTATGYGRTTLHSVRLVAGLSPVIDLDDAGAVVVLYQDRKELDRTPVVLLPGELNRLEL